MLYSLLLQRSNLGSSLFGGLELGLYYLYISITYNGWCPEEGSNLGLNLLIYIYYFNAEIGKARKKAHNDDDWSL